MCYSSSGANNYTYTIATTVTLQLQFVQNEPLWHQTKKPCEETHCRIQEIVVMDQNYEHAA